MSKRWRWFLPAYALLAPFALVYVVFLFVTFTRPTAWRWRDGVLTCISKRGRLPFNAGGQGWSWIVAYESEEARQDAPLRVHEYTHVAQEFACCTIGVVAILVLALCGEWKIGIKAGFGGAAIFHVTYGVTWLYSLITGRGRGFELYPPHVRTANGKPLPAWFRPYRSIPWEVHAYEVQDEFRHGLHANAWGAA